MFEPTEYEESHRPETLFSRTEFLKLSNHALYHRIAQIIVDFALLGHAGTASRLLAQLNTHNYFHGNHVWLRPLWFLWDTLGRWPRGEKQRVYDLIGEDQARDPATGIEQPTRKSARIEGKKSEDSTEEHVKRKLDELAFQYQKMWWRPGKRDGKPSPFLSEPSTEEKQGIVRDIIDAFDAMESRARNASTGAVAIDASSGLVSALDLALAVEAESSIPQLTSTSSSTILFKISKRMSANYQRHKLVESRRAWSLLSEGALATALNIDQEKLNTFAQQLDAVLSERFSNGRLIPSPLPMRTLLSQIERNGLPHFHSNALAAPDPRYTETFFHDPASAADIASTEDRLSITLPEDYKAFLRESNGFGPLYNGTMYEPPLFSLEKVRWTTEEEDYFTQLDFDPLCIHSTGGIQCDITIGRTLEIGTEDIDNTWLVPPAKISEYKAWVRSVLDDEEVGGEVKEKVRKQMEDFAGSEEAFWGLGWVCVTWAAGGSAMFEHWVSFKAYLGEIAEKGVGDRGGEEDLLKGHRKVWWGYEFVKEDEGGDEE